MKGKAESIPNNHVVWANGFKSNMPDWKTARECAAASSLLWWAREARSVLFAIQRPGSFADKYDDEKLGTALLGLMTAINVAEGLDKPSGFSDLMMVNGKPVEITETKTAFPIPPGFPKPPGIK